MPEKFELYRVILPDTRKVWAGVLFGFPFAATNDDKLAFLLRCLGCGILVDNDQAMTLEAFLALARQHPILSQVDWKQMGIVVDHLLEEEGKAYPLPGLAQ